MREELSSRNPYPGPRPFKREEEKLFFGRDRQVRELRSLIIAHRVALLYAQSGAGKTSLLNAGLIPLLMHEGFEILPVTRVRGLIPQDEDLRDIPNVYVFNTLIGWAEERVDPGSLRSSSLASVLKARKPALDLHGVPSPRLAIFDQFEELFTFYPEHWEKRRGFFQQVAEALEADPLLRVLFVIREDFLANLDPYVDLLPERLRTRYRLERLRGEAARLAVEGPLRDTGRSFADGVALSMVQELLEVRVETSGGEMVEVPGEFVEPVQLQVVCQNLWNGLPADVTNITSGHLQAFGDVDEALKSFYERAVETAIGETGVQEESLRLWFDNKLITSAGTRGTVFRGREQTEGVPNRVVDVLEGTHLIRAELRAGSRWYELTHDRFIGPIQKSNEVWQQHVRAAEAGQRAWRTFRKYVLVALPLVALGFAALAYFAVGEASRAKMEKRLATSRERAAGAVNNLSRDPELSILLALSAASETYTLQAEDALHKAIQAFRVTLTLRGHSRGVHGVAFSPDGTRLATASGDKTAKLWDANSGQELRTLSGHTGAVRAVAFSPDGARLATASADRTAKVWDAASGKPLLTLRHNKAVYAVTFSPDGTRLATGSSDKTAKVWDANSGGDLLTLSHKGAVHAVAFSPDGARLATASADRTAKVWDAASGKALLTLRHTQAVYAVAFSPDGARLATASAGGENAEAKLWDAAKGQELLTLSGHTNSLRGITFSPDGTRVATSSKDSTAIVWDAATGQELLTLSGHTDWVSGIAFSPDGTQVATASKDATVKVWNAAFSEEVVTLSGHDARVNGVAFSPDGRRLATTSTDKTVKLWDATSWRPLRTLTGHRYWVRGIAFDPHGEKLATTSGDRTAIVWNVKSGRKLLTLRGHGGPVFGIAFSPDGARLATASSDRTAKVWDANSGKPLLTLRHKKAVYGIAFSPDGARLATVGSERTAKIWNATTGEKLRTLSGHESRIFRVAFSPDGARLATASRDRTARVWDARTGRELLTLSGHKDEVIGVAFSPDGARLATASWDRTVRVWNAESGKELLTLTGHTAQVNGLAFSPDGKLLATVSNDETVRIYAMNIEKLTALARARVTRSLTEGECRRYLHLDRCPPAP